jgi:glutathione S-transferase
VWESLAIVEALAEAHPGVWPPAAQARARARSLCAEMHAGFGTLRSLCPMNVEAHFPEQGARFWADNAALRRDVARIDAIWSAAEGDFLFGAFTAADAFFAPVAIRLSRFALPLSAPAAAYQQRLLAHPAVAAWVADALAEADFIVEDEPYRSARGA